MKTKFKPALETTEPENDKFTIKYVFEFTLIRDGIDVETVEIGSTIDNEIDASNEAASRIEGDFRYNQKFRRI